VTETGSNAEAVRRFRAMRLDPEDRGWALRCEDPEMRLVAKLSEWRAVKLPDGRFFLTKDPRRFRAVRGLVEAYERSQALERAAKEKAEAVLTSAHTSKVSPDEIYPPPQSPLGEEASFLEIVPGEQGFAHVYLRLPDPASEPFDPEWSLMLDALEVDDG
jgi:hypothetical protein